MKPRNIAWRAEKANKDRRPHFMRAEECKSSLLEKYKETDPYDMRDAAIKELSRRAVNSKAVCRNKRQARVLKLVQEQESRAASHQMHSGDARKIK